MISRTTLLALRELQHIARRGPQEAVSLREIAAASGSSASHLAKVAGDLALLERLAGHGDLGALKWWTRARLMIRRSAAMPEVLVPCRMSGGPHSLEGVRNLEGAV